MDWNKQQLRDYQTNQLRKIVHNAFENVPFYQRMFKAAGIQPSEIRSANDLNKIPIVKKSELKKLPATDIISKDTQIENLKKITTGGSTGQPFSMYIDSKEDAWRKAIYLRANIACGQRIRDKWVTIIDTQYNNDSSRLQNSLGFYVRHIVPITLDRASRFRAVQDMNPDVLDGFPNALYLLAKDYEQNGGKLIQPRIMFGSGELVDKSTISFLEKTFNAPYFDQFGCTEIDRSAWQCNQRNGYHMDMDSVIVQFVDEEGDEVSQGEKGEVVYTSLFNYAFPILRYNVEDVGVPTDEECSCGKKLPLMKVVEGRNNSFLVFSDNRIMSPIQFIEVLGAFKLVKEIEQYRVIQETRNYVRIIVQKTSKNVDEAKIRHTLLTNLANGIPDIASQNSGGTFEIEFVDEITRTLHGKLAVVSSKVAKNTCD